MMMEPFIALNLIQFIDFWWFLPFEGEEAHKPEDDRSP
jgi:hypothetical protein